MTLAVAHKERRVIACPVHGNIPLGRLENELISTGAFQRLRRIGQLGLAELVYPGASYSRFSHSIGVCHLAGRLLTCVCNNSEIELNETTLKLYRAAALLHDIGHYPFSHSTEHALKKLAIRSKSADEDEKKVPEGFKYLNHEEVGMELLKNDEEIIKVFKDNRVNHEEIIEIFTRKAVGTKDNASVVANPEPSFHNIVSSDLDADRMDYLLRTAHHSGLPYGKVDVNYLCEQLKFKNEKLHLENRAIRPVDHFHLARYFDYRQIVFHKTVKGLEQLLEDLIGNYYRELGLEKSEVEKKINNREWQRFDDSHVYQFLKEKQIRLQSKPKKSEHGRVISAKLNALINRNPPILLFDFEHFLPHKNAKNIEKIFQRQAKSIIMEFSRSYAINPDHWFVWATEFELTKLPGKISSTEMDEGSKKLRSKLRQTVMVKDKNENIIHLFESDESLMKEISAKLLLILRVYFLSEGTPIDQAKINKMKSDFNDAFEILKNI